MLRWSWLSVLVIALDQVSKYLAATKLTFAIPEPVFPGFSLLLLHNTGAAFSFLSDAAGWQRWFFIALALVVSAVILAWLKRLSDNERWTAVALAMILGGALGNVIDRMVHGYVIDFLDFYYDTWHWPAFNLADSAITVGAAILIIHGLFSTQHKDALR